MLILAEVMETRVKIITASSAILVVVGGKQMGSFEPRYHFIRNENKYPKL